MPRGLRKSAKKPDPEHRPAVKKVKEKAEVVEDEPKVENVPHGTINCSCGHLSKMHYGSKDSWCNVGGCKCLAYEPGA